MATPTATLREFLASFEAQHRLKINMLSYGSTMLYGYIRQKEKLEERLNTTIPKLVEMIGGKPVPAHQRYIVLECLAEDQQGEDVDVPYIRYQV